MVVWTLPVAIGTLRLSACCSWTVGPPDKVAVAGPELAGRVGAVASPTAAAASAAAVARHRDRLRPAGAVMVNAVFLSFVPCALGLVLVLTLVGGSHDHHT